MNKYTFESIVEAYQKQMLYVAERILHNHHDAEDAVQTALFRISRQCKFLPQNDSALRAYVLTAAKHAALDLLPNRPPNLNTDEITLPYSDTLFESLVATHDYERLLSAIRALPAIYRDVLMLRYVQQLDTKNIAKLLNRPRATIQKQLSRAKSLLLQIYHKEDP